ncbi:Cathepsin L [Oopsacas minuta]|uniref:Cathepsin L n=1 Tax=Oopsacas minuta TaxID=111878 RepID=A0AAV7JD10_9METZ|nr:Cathepsin L [Oopsacas minuta]
MQFVLLLALTCLTTALCSPLIALESAQNTTIKIAQDVLEITRGVADLEELLEEWEMWKMKHSKIYTDIYKEFYRLKIWSDNIRYIQKHNADTTHSHKLGANRFADLTQAEYSNLYLSEFSPSLTGAKFLEPSNLLVPDCVDWREKGYVTDVKNQEACGSCWSFSTTGSLEGQHFRKTNKLVSLSEQNLIDCSGSYGNKGCNGGVMDYAFAYIKKNGGIDTEADYPYVADQTDCQYKSDASGATLRDWVDINSENETQLLIAVASQGPISVAIDASHSSFQLYESGVYAEPDCSSSELDHGVLVVGYGIEDGVKYWLVKNSWGASWGEDGYIKMTRGADNQCGISTMASYPVV